MIWYIKCHALVTMKYNPQQKTHSDEGLAIPTGETLFA